MEFKDYSSQMFEQWKNTYQSIHHLNHHPTYPSGLKAEDYRQAIQSYPRPFKVNLDQFSCKDFLQATLNEAIEQKHLLMDDQTLLLYDLSQYSSTSYNSLPFQLDQTPIKSYEQTKTVIKRYSQLNKCPLSWSKILANSLGYKQRVPYVFANQIFLPDRGTSKQNASWLAMHNIRYVDFDSKRRKTYIYGLNNNKICLTGDKQCFEEHLARCANIYHIQKKMAEDIMLHWQACDFIMTPCRNNIIENYLRREDFIPIDYNYCDYLMYLIYLEAQTIIIEITQEDNPFIEDFQNLFKLRKEEF